MSTAVRSLAPVVVVALAILVAACTGAASGAPASPSPSSAAPSDPAAPTLTPVPVPGASGSADDGAGSSNGSTGSGSTGSGSTGGGSTGGGSDAGGGTSGNPGTGGLVPIGPGGGGGNPVQPVPSMVKPVTGLSGIHDVSATALHASVSGRRVAVQVAWWSGVEPCSVLAGVDVQRDGSTFTLTVREGSAAAPDTMCIEIAMYKATIVDLGDLDPGTYEVRAPRDAAPLEIVVEG